MDYININDYLSYNKLFTFIIGVRSNGKTYGALEYCVKRFIKNKEQFIYLRRYKQEIKNLDTLFDPLIKNHPDWNIKVKGRKFYFNDKPMGFAHPLSQTVIQASISTPDVWWIIFDEFLLAPGNYRYLTDEVNSYLLHFWLTVSRYRNVKIIFIANAYSIVNPYFLELGIKMENGIYKDDEILAVMTGSEKHKEDVLQTRSAKILTKTAYADFAIDNKFKLDDTSFVLEKTPESRYKFDMKYEGLQVGVWLDYQEMVYYISRKCSVNGKNSIIYALSNTDLQGSTLYAKNVRGIFNLENIAKFYRKGKLYFEDLEIKNKYEGMISKW